MIRVIGSRGSGKTTQLLNLAKEKGLVFVAPNARMADCVREMATEKGYNVTVINSHEMLNRRGYSNEKYLVDELDLFLNTLGIEGYSNGTL